MSSYLDYPFHFDATGRTATTEVDDHVRDLIYQVLFTNPGERVNRPDFGCGLLQLVFMPNSDALAAATQFMVQGALQRWLANVIQLESVKIENTEERLIVEVNYQRLDTGEHQVASFNTGVGGPTSSS
jgi:phage baseplate assembly protein W